MLLCQTCERELRDALKLLYPSLDTDPSYWTMMLYLIFPSHVDKEGRAVISRETLAVIEGKKHLVPQMNYCGEEFLERFKHDVLPQFEYSDWRYTEKKARVVLNSGLAPEIEELLDRVIEKLFKGTIEKVFISTGAEFSTKQRAKRRRLLFELAIQQVYESNRRIVEYQNSLDPKIFTGQVKGTFRAALEYVIDNLTGLGKRQALAQLKAIDEEPKPFLHPVGKSDRVFSMQPSLLTVQSEVRHILTRGWYEYDLVSAQLAAIAMLWKLHELQDFLASGKSIWAHLYEVLGVDPSYKAGLKKAIYALAYGASQRRMKDEFIQKTGDKHKAAQLLKVPLIQSLLKARQARTAAIRQAGGLTTLFGQTIPVKSRDDIRSALAREAQAVEVALINSIYELAETTKRFTVVLYSFDGVTISYRDADAVATWEARIKKAVKDKADELGVITELVGGLLK